MPSSTSSSEPAPQRVERGYARRVPAIRWATIALGALVLAVVATGVWEASMRHLGLRAGDLDDGDGAWAVERRKVDSGPRDQVVLIGDSRILFDSDLAIWQQLTGIRPIQLALEGTNGGPFLEELANDEHFAGLVVIGIAPTSFFRDGIGLHSKVLKYLHSESPSQRLGHILDKQLQRSFAFLDANYALFPLIERRRMPERPSLIEDHSNPYYDVWKLRETTDDRQTTMWPRIQTDRYLNEHARLAWGDFAGKVIPDQSIATVIAKAKINVDRIRARGGEVVWLRPPSSGKVLINENLRLARPRSWDLLLRETHSFGVHFEDYPAAVAMSCPELSHLNARDASEFTRIYVTALREHVPWLQTHANAGAGHERPDSR